jgi:hypothetical protein
MMLSLVLLASLHRVTPVRLATRRGLGRGLATAVATISAPVLALDPKFPRIDEGSDKGTILTAKPLEWIRVKRQLDADDKLGELEDPNSTDSPGSRLARVLRLEDAIRAMGPQLASVDGRALALAALLSPSFETKAIKKAFNAYSDNVFYEKKDSDRANLYLAGGTPPSSKQTIQYMNRNDALDQVQLFRDELDYLKKNPAEQPEDAKAAQAAAVKAFDNYFALAPADDVKAARAVVGPAGPGTRN